MHKLYIKLAVLGAVLSGFFLAAPFAYAFTLVSSPASPFTGFMQSESNANIALLSGQAGTVGVYLAYNSSFQTGSNTFYIQLENSSFVPLDCLSDNVSFNSLGISGFPNPVLSSQGVQRFLTLHGTQCGLVAGQQYAIKAIASTTAQIMSQGSTTVSTTDVWYIITTDTASSSIFTYQDSVLSIATSSVASYCNATYSGLSIGADIANALCNVAGFLFIPDSNILQSFTSLQTTASTKIPLSYFYDFVGMFQTQSASSTQNLPTYTVNLGDVDPASTTALGSILPQGQFALLSTTTIGKYLPVGIHDTLFSLAELAIWFGVAYWLYHKAQRVFYA